MRIRYSFRLEYFAGAPVADPVGPNAFVLNSTLTVSTGNGMLLVDVDACTAYVTPSEDVSQYTVESD